MVARPLDARERPSAARRWVWSSTSEHKLALGHTGRPNTWTKLVARDVCGVLQHSLPHRGVCMGLLCVGLILLGSSAFDSISGCSCFITVFAARS